MAQQYGYHILNIVSEMWHDLCETKYPNLVKVSPAEYKTLSLLPEPRNFLTFIEFFRQCERVEGS